MAKIANKDSFLDKSEAEKLSLFYELLVFIITQIDINLQNYVLSISNIWKVRMVLIRTSEES